MGSIRVVPIHLDVCGRCDHFLLRNQRHLVQPLGPSIQPNRSASLSPLGDSGWDDHDYPRPTDERHVLTRYAAFCPHDNAKFWLCLAATVRYSRISTTTYFGINKGNGSLLEYEGLETCSRSADLRLTNSDRHHRSSHGRSRRRGRTFYVRWHLDNGLFP